MTLGERMKAYEFRTRQILMPGIPAVIRLDMRCGHSFCKDLDRPFDLAFGYAMRQAMASLCRAIPGAVLGYTQSDEISIVLRHTVDERDQEQFFAGRVEKIVSVTASMCTLAFNRAFAQEDDDRNPDLYWTAQFDSRVFSLPNATEVHNYLVWRQQDAERNSLNMLARSQYSTRELVGKKRADLHDMLMAKGINWNDLAPTEKRGTYIACDLVYTLAGQKREWLFGTERFSQMPDFVVQLFARENETENA